MSTESITATIVFTDLVDSTATAARLGPEGAEELRQAHFRLLRGAVTATAGREVKNLGDGLMVVYSSPSRALAGAVGMQQAVEHHNRSAAEPLGVRIGISTGEAVEEDDDLFGDPVVEAARLCAAADAGQILAAELVRLMVGRSAAQTFVDVGELALKGIPEPVATVEVLWEPAVVEGTVPLPGRLVGAASDGLFGFFGREAELAALADVLKRAHAAGRAQAVFVAGEAGMGKTSLVARAARQAHAEGATVLFGHSDEDLGVSYQPWIELITGLVRGGDEAWIAGLRPAQRSALSRLVPDVGADEGGLADPDAERLLLLDAVVDLLAAASAEDPVVVVLDDLHWADTASLQLLRHLVASATPMDVAIVVTYCDTDLSRGDALTQLLADMHREPNTTRVGLRGLVDTDVTDLIAAAAGHDLDDDGIGLAHAVRRETDGNPFFTAEILRHLGESGGIVQGDDGRWALVGELADLGLPSSVRDVVGRRVERLGDEALRVLGLAAVIGRDFDLDLLARLADVDEDGLLDLVDAAVGAAVLVETDVVDRYRFAHALVQHSLYDDLSPSRRQRAHRRVAEAIEERAARHDAASLGELAHHWVAATRPADVDKALDYIRRAGDAALAALAADDAIRWYEQALGLLAAHGDDDRRRADLLAALGTAQAQAGHPEFRATLVEAVSIGERLDDVDLLVRAALAYSIEADQAGDPDKVRVATAALDHVGPDDPVRPRLLALLASGHDAVRDWRVRRELALEAIAGARRAEDETTLVAVLDAVQSALATPERLPEAIADVERAAAIADEVGDVVMQEAAGFSLVWVRWQQCDTGGADELVVTQRAIVDRIGLPYQRWRLSLATTARLLLAGDADGAEVENEHGLELGTAAGLSEVFGTYGALLYCIRRHQGRLDEIVEFFVDVARDNPSVASLRPAVADMLCLIGRPDDAIEWVAASTADLEGYPFDIQWLNGMRNCLDAAASVGDGAALRTLVDMVGPYHDQVVAPSATLVEGAIARPLARAATVLGDVDQAEAWFAIAHDIHARLQAPYWTALGQLDHADLCLVRRGDGDLDRARALVASASELAERYGCAGLTRRATGLLDGL